MAIWLNLRFVRKPQSQHPHMQTFGASTDLKNSVFTLKKQRSLRKPVYFQGPSARKELRASSLHDREKLRSLVGNNYRNLLSTAEQIISLDQATRKAEVDISSLGQACQPPKQNFVSRDADETVRIAAQIKFIDALLRSTSKSTQARLVGRASKTLIIVRLLLKHLEVSERQVDALRWLSNRSKNARRQLLSVIDSLLTRPSTQLAKLVEAASAYCLTTSSSSTEVISHLQTLRGQRLTNASGEATGSGASIKDLTQACYYLTASVAAIKALSGRGMTEMLGILQKQPILKDQEVEEIDALHLDLVRDLLPSDILQFTPYFKRATLSPSQLATSLEDWVGTMIKSLVSYIEQVVDGYGLTRVLKARNSVLESLLPSTFSAYLHHSALEAVRQCFNRRVVELLQQQAQKLLKYSTALNISQNTPMHVTFWDSVVTRTPVTKSTDTYLRTLKASHLGVGDDLQKALLRLRTWVKGVQRTRNELQSLSGIRWQDRIEEYDNEDEDIAREIVAGLSKGDSDCYLETLEQAMQKASLEVVTTLDELAADVISKEQSLERQRLVVGLLRMVRELRDMFQKLVPQHHDVRLMDTTAGLQDTLVQQTVSQLFEGLKSVGSPGEDFVANDLPSPPVVAVLRQLCTLMLQTGGMDLWNRDTVLKLKPIVLEAALSEEHRKSCIRHSFDEHYLRAALSNPVDVGSTAADSVERKAILYWTRTRTLFGMLDTLT